MVIPAGEQGYTALEQGWARPTCEINGITGGYDGDGFKTVLPGKAQAKVSFRMVAGQDPERVRDSFRTHVRASVLPNDGTALKLTLAALTAERTKPAVIGSAARSRW